jgi:WD40 repeat protein
MTFDYHKESVRAVDFSEDGNMIYTASADKSIAVITNGKMAGQLLDAHDAPIHSLVHLD